MRYLINENVWTDTHILFEKKQRLIISQRTEVSLILTPQLTAETQTYYHYCPHEPTTGKINVLVLHVLRKYIPLNNLSNNA